MAINRDLVRYRERYPGEHSNNPRQTLNLKFYQNEVKSVPDGDYIDEIHKKWFGEYRMLEVHHGYVQWLFPIHEEGMNYQAQVLQAHEREAMIRSEAIMDRIKRSYELILDFYGAKIISWKTGELVRTSAYKDRFSNLNSRFHNYLRITRILKWLGEMSLEHLKFAFLIFFAQEAVFLGTLPNVSKSLRDFWLATLRCDGELEIAVKFVDGKMDFEEAMDIVRDISLRGMMLPKEIELGDPECTKSPSLIYRSDHLDTSCDDDSDLDRQLVASSSTPSAVDMIEGAVSGGVGVKRRAEEEGGKGDAQDAGSGGGGGGRGAAGANCEKSADPKSRESSKSFTSSDSDDELDPDSHDLDAAGRARVLAQRGEVDGLVSED